MNNDMETIEQPCPVCEETISVDVPENLSTEIGKARIRVQINNHLEQHGKIELFVAIIKLFIRGLLP